MNQQQLGAHEAMEIHEVLTDTIDGINQFELYQPYCQDPQLQNILQNQINFMMSEYDRMVKAVQNTGNQTGVAYRSAQQSGPVYGMSNAASSEQPNTSTKQMNDHDISSGMLGCSKSSAVLRMHGALECADPVLRNLMIQGAKNCADQAYETWQFMNNKGYYQVPTMQSSTTQSVINHYQPVTGMAGQQPPLQQ